MKSCQKNFALPIVSHNHWTPSRKSVTDEIWNPWACWSSRNTSTCKLQSKSNYCLAAKCSKHLIYSEFSIFYLRYSQKLLGLLNISSFLACQSSYSVLIPSCCKKLHSFSLLRFRKLKKSKYSDILEKNTFKVTGNVGKQDQMEPVVIIGTPCQSCNIFYSWILGGCKLLSI